MQSHALTVDLAGRRTRINEADGTQRAYGYDGVNRLVSEQVTGGGGPTYTNLFAYDPVGNRQSRVTTGEAVGSTTYSYDERDRLLALEFVEGALDGAWGMISSTGAQAPKGRVVRARRAQHAVAAA